ncbi:hypothetical protein ABH943_006836 [Caballeronia udeis]|uniref:Uncharacterized protein n=1 Tax=Caballeronia udeis TaxID=1232866 RepID=A0ABW8MU01_9BURK
MKSSAIAIRHDAWEWRRNFPPDNRKIISTGKDL